MGDEWISAGDIEKYGYCPLSWWLSREKEEVVNERMKKGMEDHKKMGDALEDLQEKEKKLVEVENMVLWLAVAASLVSVGGLTFLRPEGYLRQIFIVISLIWLLAATFFLYIGESKNFSEIGLKSEKIVLAFAMIATILALFAVSLGLTDANIARISQVISLSWLVGASYWLKVSLSLKAEAKDKRDEYNVDNGSIDYVDGMKGEEDMLVSEEYKIRGRPDYIIENDGELIPVEVKTGRVPKGPFFSHILQAGAYCLLIEADKGIKPPHAIVQYGEKKFQVEYDEDLKDLVIEKVLEMRRLIETEDVHRNHNRKGKCANCSRREFCPESLV